jgi:hypothetical protein
MADMRVGDDFIKHELDEAIAFQQAIVEAEEQLGKAHPNQEAQQAIKSALGQDQKMLKQLQDVGKPFGATGAVEEVAGAMQELMRQTGSKADSAESEAYEAHAVLVTLKRKQQDSASAMLKIARARNDDTLKQAADEFGKASKTSAQELADLQAEFAVAIATQ